MRKPLPPIACSLTARESASQVDEWRDLAGRTLTKVRVAGGYQVTFAASEAAVVEELARRESACCGFLDLVVDHFDGRVRLMITSENPDARPLIDLLVG